MLSFECISFSFHVLIIVYITFELLHIFRFMAPYSEKLVQDQVAKSESSVKLQASSVELHFLTNFTRATTELASTKIKKYTAVLKEDISNKVQPTPIRSFLSSFHLSRRHSEA